MSIPHRIRGVKILKAVSSPLRLQILNLLFDRGLLSYTELMSSLKMNPSRDAGRFAYHLKFLLRTDLIEADVEAKKYCLTELGKMVIDVADRIEKKALKPKSMLVRTSRFTLEEFDVNKIASSLIKEAKMPAELAQKVAKEAEKRLIKSKTKYLTAPLVREIVNAILVEKGLEEYRHKLTRLGLPVHEVTSLIEEKSRVFHGSAVVDRASGETVLREYMLLNILPRDIADAHLSGLLNIKNLSSWILKPSEVMHDLRFFFQNGLHLEKMDALLTSLPPPQNLDSALSLVFDILMHSAKEVDEGQTLEYFNVFLAPFAKNVEPAKIKELLRSFIFNINQHLDASLSLELIIPDFLAEKPAIGPFGKLVGKYDDFREESSLLLSSTLEIFAEESSHKPLLNPRVVIKIRSETFVDEKAKTVFLKAHQLASERGLPYFANLLGKSQKCSAFSSSGFRLKAYLSEDWEIDTLRAGCLGFVTINMSRIVEESGKDKARFFEIFRDRLEMAMRALEIKYDALKRHSKGLLPFLMQNVNNDQYFRLEKCSQIISLAGLKEAAEAFCGKSIYEDMKALEFVREVTKSVMDFAQKIGRKRVRYALSTALPDFEASERLAQLDIERYGVAKVRFSGTREKPFYSTIGRLVIKDNKEILPESLIVEQASAGINAAGNLTIVELGDTEFKSDELASLTKQVFEAYDLAVLKYNRKLTYCTNCRQSWFGLLHKCPVCGAVDTLVFFDQYASV